MLLDHDKLGEIASEKASLYRRAGPFPHIVLDDFLPEYLLQKVLSEMPDPADEGLNWRCREAEMADGSVAQLRKFGLGDDESLPDITRQLVWELNSGTFMRFLKTLTGIRSLTSDPYLNGAGIHMIAPGGFLRVHADYNFHPITRLDRRLNLLLYLNPDWKEEYGGHLELWDREMTTCKKRILPIANRLVIFNTTSSSYHGHPRPLTCPPGRARQSLALYYYTNGRPSNEATERHATLWQKLPGEQ